ncbi:misexpression suppressor of ras 6 isoform X3 [Tachypleus tridentatus]|uniref:misexpression suppressor of ras 6 isoform X3 n=1 Tax=Tachypleus tridentatus TaxID=6853 RepID=UPI003FCEE846
MTEKRIPMFKKQKVPLPVVVVEDHNEVLYHIYRAIGRKLLPFADGTIIHLDSHPDLLLPKNFDLDRIWDKHYIFNSVNIENWLLPAALAGHFRNIYWVKPSWSRQVEDGIHHFQIGRHKRTGQVRLTCTEPYFVSELLYAPATDLERPREITLGVCTVGGTEGRNTGHDVLTAIHTDLTNLLSSGTNEESRKKLTRQTTSEPRSLAPRTPGASHGHITDQAKYSREGLENLESPSQQGTEAEYPIQFEIPGQNPGTCSRENKKHSVGFQPAPIISSSKENNGMSQTFLQTLEQTSATASCASVQPQVVSVAQLSSTKHSLPDTIPHVQKGAVDGLKSEVETNSRKTESSLKSQELVHEHCITKGEIDRHHNPADPIENTKSRASFLSFRESKVGPYSKVEDNLIKGQMPHRNMESGFGHVLDIDLDFYSTQNPFKLMFTEFQFEKLKRLYQFEKPATSNVQDLLEATAARENQLQDLETLIQHVRAGGDLETSPQGSKRKDEMRHLLEELGFGVPHETPPIDLELLHDAGLTCDDTELPHHVSSREEIRHLVEKTTDFLKRLPRPSLVTIARSVSLDIFN